VDKAAKHVVTTDVQRRGNGGDWVAGHGHTEVDAPVRALSVVVTDVTPNVTPAKDDPDQGWGRGVNVTLQRAVVTLDDRVASPSSHAPRSRWPLNLCDVLWATGHLSAEVGAPVRLCGVRHGLSLRQLEVPG